MTLRERLLELRQIGWTMNDLIEFADDLESLAKVKSFPKTPKQEEQRLKEQSEKLIPQIVSEKVQKIGIPPHIKGYRYIVEAIIMCVNDENVMESVSTNLYSKIAEKFSTTPSRVERGIRYGIEIACSRGNMDYYQKVFGYMIERGTSKPSNSKFIVIIADKVRMEMK